MSQQQSNPISFIGTRIGVVKAKKVQEDNSTRKFIAKPQVDNNFGVVAYVGDAVTHLKEGDQVYFATQLELLLIDGNEIMIMDASNVIAKKVG